MWPPVPTRRMRWLPVSAMTARPSASNATPAGWSSWARRPDAPSPLSPQVPSPATVVMVPAVSMRRIRQLAVSAMSTSPVAETATASGWSRAASVAGPPSPVSSQVPVPATVEMVPAASMRRIRQLPVSATSSVPSVWRASPRG